MAFTANDRVRVTSQASEHRGMLGTVLVAAADTAHGFNNVRLDGFAVGNSVQLADKELADTNFTSPVEYTE